MKTEDRKKDAEERATVAHASENEVTQMSDEQLQAKERTVTAATAKEKADTFVATAKPDGSAMVLVAEREDDNSEENNQDDSKTETLSEPGEEYVTRAELQQLLEEAYLRGRNEKTAARIEEDRNIRQSATPTDDDLAGLFIGRPSVWEE